jgi:hypothetical protein
MEKINLGCGKDIREGWENTDEVESVEKENETVDAILLNHVAMYFRPEDMERLLRRWHGWLVEGGTIHIETQNLDKINTPEILYGMGKNAGHKWGWTPETLGKLMKESGFKNIVSVPGILHGWPERDFIITGTK